MKNQVTDSIKKKDELIWLINRYGITTKQISELCHVSKKTVLSWKCLSLHTIPDRHLRTVESFCQILKQEQKALAELRHLEDIEG
jgi:hypothetical protein